LAATGSDSSSAKALCSIDEGLQWLVGASVVALEQVRDVEPEDSAAFHALEQIIVIVN
jgi:hypothetical protein